jgi:hypothetical protein
MKHQKRVSFNESPTNKVVGSPKGKSGWYFKAASVPSTKEDQDAVIIKLTDLLFEFKKANNQEQIDTLIELL